MVSQRGGPSCVLSSLELTLIFRSEERTSKMREVLEACGVVELGVSQVFLAKWLLCINMHLYVYIPTTLRFRSCFPRFFCILKGSDLIREASLLSPLSGPSIRAARPLSGSLSTAATTWPTPQLLLFRVTGRWVPGESISHLAIY